MNAQDRQTWARLPWALLIIAVWLAATWWIEGVSR